jgi:TonB-dependent receptor
VNSCPAGNGHNVNVSSDVYVYTIPQFDAPPMVWGDWDKLWPLVYPNSDVPSFAEQLLSHTRVGEKMAEGYAKLNIDTMLGQLPLTGGIGVRVAHVSTKSDGYTQTGTVFNPITAHNSYTDVLPSVNLTAHLSENQLLRFGAAIAVARPPLDVLGAGISLNQIQLNQPATGSGGNPYLMPFKAKQIDLSYENYFHEESLFAVAPFFKHLDTFVAGGVQPQMINGINYLIGTSTNGKGGNAWGVETTFQTRFYFLPGLLQNFGVYTNYTYANSNVHEMAPASNPYKMVGVAKHTAEFDTFYSQGGFEARVAFKYHSPFPVAPTWNGANLKELGSEKILDASLSYQVTKQVGLRFQAHNLTNAPRRLTNDNNTSNLSNDGGYQVYGRSYLMDVSVKF